MHKNQRGFGVIEALLILFILAVVGSIAWYTLNANKGTPKTTAPNNTPTAKSIDKTDIQSTTTTVTEEGPYKGWNLYTSKFGFSVKYPANGFLIDDNQAQRTIDETRGGNHLYVWIYSAGYNQDNCSSPHPEEFPDCEVKIEFEVHQDTSADAVIVNTPSAELQPIAQRVIDSYQQKK